MNVNKTGKHITGAPDALEFQPRSYLLPLSLRRRFVQQRAEVAAPVLVRAFDLVRNNLCAFRRFVLFLADSRRELYRVGFINAPRVSVKTDKE